ncbi:MAG: hypothetical protein P8P30_08355 [Rickettsiales bacterium]|nr:hypothetical protein [Rickettsiales bacterium]
MRFIFTSLVIFAALSAYAADYTAGTKCPAKVHHKPMANLEYEAGKTASGYAVAPADEVPPALSADDFAQVKLPLDIPVESYLDKGRGEVTDVNERINLNTDRMELRTGEVAVNAKTGGVSFNGRDISTVEPTLANPDCWTE